MNNAILYQWQQEIGSHLPSLNSWQVANVALMSYGVMKAEGSQQQKVARHMRGREQVASATRRIRRFLDNERFPLVAFWTEWVRWIVSALGGQHITLLVDETKLHDRIAVMVVGVAWENRCLPLVWRAYEANPAAAYPAEGQVAMIEGLLAMVKAGLPEGCEVLVLADRGIGCSPDLCRAVERLGWRYLFRLTCQTKIVTADAEYTIAQQVQPGEIWAASGLVFKKRGHIPGRALALWGLGYDEPWALITNDHQLTGHEYARRNWQEQSFRDLKSGGWHWDESLVRHPDHVTRLLVLLVVAYCWTVALGSQAVMAQASQPLIRRAAATPQRFFSLFREGLDFLCQQLEDFSTFCGIVFFSDFRFT
jgi:Transposase DDE domain